MISFDQLVALYIIQCDLKNKKNTENSLILNSNKMLSNNVRHDIPDKRLFFPLTDSDSHKQKLEKF